MKLREPQEKLVPGDRVMLTAAFVMGPGGGLYEVARMRGTLLHRGNYAMDLLPGKVRVQWDDADRPQRISRSVLWPVGRAE